MFSRIHIPAALLVLITAISAPGFVRAAESFDNCTGFIDSVPATISTQGTWCLRKDLSTGIASGNAVTIDANNVTLDCNDFKLGGLAAGPGTYAIGILAHDRHNVTIRKCNVRGFAWGVYLSGLSGHKVELNRLDGNTSKGVSVRGDGSVVRHNHVRDTGGSTALSGPTIGIEVIDGVDVIDNKVGGVTPSTSFNSNGTTIGIYTLYSYSGSISGNRITGLQSLEIGTAFGILNEESVRVGMFNNHVIGNMDFDSVGLECSSSDGRAVNNIINGFATAIVGCGDEGNSL